MKLITSLVLLFAPCFTLHAQSTLEVFVELTRPDAGGSVSMAVCPGAKAYESAKGCLERTVPADGAVVRLVFNDIEPGEYAIKALHDINKNGDMDYNMIGMPKEPYGFSNNVMGTLGPPSFEDAKFLVGPGKNTTRFKMRN